MDKSVPSASTFAIFGTAKYGLQYCRNYESTSFTTPKEKDNTSLNPPLCCGEFTQINLAIQMSPVSIPTIKNIKILIHSLNKRKKWKEVKKWKEMILPICTTDKRFELTDCWKSVANRSNNMNNINHISFICQDTCKLSIVLFDMVNVIRKSGSTVQLEITFNSVYYMTKVYHLPLFNQYEKHYKNISSTSTSFMTGTKEIQDEKWVKIALYDVPSLFFVHTGEEKCKELRNIMYIDKEITSEIISDETIKECFESPKDLFYALKGIIKMQVIDGEYKLFISTITDCEIGIFNSELHTKSGGHILYIISVKNNKLNAEKWKMKGVLTSAEIWNKYGIKNADLPVRSRKKYGRVYNLCVNKKHIMIEFNLISHLKQISSSKQKKKHKNNPNTLNVYYKEFNDKLYEAIKSSDEKHKLLKIIYFQTNKETQTATYCIQYLLPVKLDNNWIGIAFDTNTENETLIPVEILIDCKDIRNKLALLHPLKNKNEFKWLNNNITALNICDNQEYIGTKRLRNEIKQYQQIIEERDTIIARLYNERILLENKLMQYENIISNLQ